MTASVRRRYGELDRDEVLAALHNLARRIGVRRVTMRELAAELGAAAPSVYYHIPNKQAALDLLAESVLAQIPEPAPGSWDNRLIELYCCAREVLLGVPGIATVLQTHGTGERARRLSRLSMALIADSGLAKPAAAAAHSVLYTYLLGSVSLQESGRPIGRPRGQRHETARFRAGLEVIIAGISSSRERQ
jgi:TetR/AcrR family transcriptional regulator, tetracycline repressor protein